MFALPAGYQAWKFVLLLVVLGIIATRSVWLQKLFVSVSVLLFFLGFIGIGLAFTLLGLANGNPGALPMAKEYVLYVGIYMVLIMGVNQYQYLNYIDKTLTMATLFVCLYALVTVLVALGLYPQNWYVDLYANSGMQGVDISRNYATLDMPSLPSLMFLQPYLATKIVLSRSRVSPVTWIAFLAATLVMIFVGRRVLILVGLLVPFLIALFVLSRDKGFGAPMLRFAGIGVLALCVAATILFILQSNGYDVSAYIAAFVEGFTAAEAGGAVRIEQFLSLIDRWLDNMLFGYGLGAIHPGLIRSIDEPWNFELSYVKMLYDVGLVGAMLYAIGIGTVYWVSVRIARLDRAYSRFLLPMIVGSTAFLIGNATNPYLLKFDYLAVLFLPIALINYWRLDVYPRMLRTRRLEGDGTSMTRDWLDRR